MSARDEEVDGEGLDLLEIAVRLAVAMVKSPGKRLPATIADEAVVLAAALQDGVVRVEQEREARQCDGCTRPAVHRDADDADELGMKCCGTGECCMALPEDEGNGWMRKPLEGP